ncbi:hypothetical protein KAI87_14640 [Myxococcota bacterium]|nr:hypothetical protein [Myxococcota bacterium]
MKILKNKNVSFPHLIMVLLALFVVAPGCILGTWPEPEEKAPVDPSPEPVAMGSEICNDLDDDADGVVDEGCPCSSDAPSSGRECIGIDDGACATGTQYCTENIWQLCSELGEPTTPLREAEVFDIQTHPTTLTRNTSDEVIVTAQIQTRCEGIVARQVKVTLSSTQPAMSLIQKAHDDGVANDNIAEDSVFTASLVNPFGPGVTEQTLEVRVDAVIDGENVSAETGLELVQ